MRPNFTSWPVWRANELCHQIHEPHPSFLLHNKKRPSDSLGSWGWSCWILAPAPVPWAPAGWMGMVPKGAAQEQLPLSSMEALPQECHGIFWITAEVHVPLGVNIYLLRRLGSSALSSLPSLWHLWDTSSLVCGITSSSKLFLTLYSYSSSMCLTILELIWVMTNRIRY